MDVEIRPEVPLAPLLSFHVGGPARFFCAPHDVEQCAAALRQATEHRWPVFVLGKGTNVVFADAGFDGLVLYTGEFTDIASNGSTVTAACGAALMDVVTQSVDRGWAGLQNLAGIPGTVGGGTFINAGAFDQEFKDVVTAVESLRPDGTPVLRSNSACGFGYRRSVFSTVPELIVRTTFLLRAGDASALRQEMEATLDKRAARQPLDFPNAGSMFKRPPGGYAGALIEAAGLKGLRRGGAGISAKHANFTVNLGNATAQDIWDLTSEVIGRVRAHSGVTLEREVIFVGKFQPWPRSA